MACCLFHLEKWGEVCKRCRSGFPASRVQQINNMIDPVTAEG